jgi:hypothetical protein
MGCALHNMPNLFTIRLPSFLECSASAALLQMLQFSGALPRPAASFERNEKEFH